MTVFPIASGSTGNCLLVSYQDTHILIDAGVSAKKITTALATRHLSPNQLSGIFITHVHSDHVSGLAVLTKKAPVPLFATQETILQLVSKSPELRPLCHQLLPNIHHPLGELSILPFPTSHDCVGSVGFSVQSPSGKMAIATDLGFVTQAVWEGVEGCDLLVAETNHDLDLLENGPYPPHLKQRVASDRGHLSNYAGAELIANAVSAGARTLLLAHLSKENNTPSLARNAVLDLLQQHNLFSDALTVEVLGEGFSSVAYPVRAVERSHKC